MLRGIYAQQPTETHSPCDALSKIHKDVHISHANYSSENLKGTELLKDMEVQS